MQWKVSSPLFGLVLRQHFPSDTYMVAKCGNRLRIDGSLTGLDADAKSLLPRWKRGSVSVLLAPPPAGSSAASKPDPRVALVSHDQKTIKWLGRILKQVLLLKLVSLRKGIPPQAALPA